MKTELNHTIFGGRSSWNPKPIFGIAVAIALAAGLAWLAFSKTHEELYQEAYDAGRFDDALAEARSLIAANPNSAQPLVAAAAALIQKAYQGQDRAASALAAADFAREAAALDPSSVEAWRALGAAQLISGDGAGAAESYARAAVLAPKDVPLLVQMGDAVAASNPEAAAALYKKALATAPDDPAANLGAARSALAAGNAEQAIAHLKPAVAEGVPSVLVAEAKVTLSDVELGRGHERQAITSAEEALALVPESASAKIALARALYQGIFTLRLTPDATLAQVRALAAEAQAIQPSSAMAAFVSFQAASAAGDKAAAAAAATRARALIPNDPTLSAAGREELSAQIDLLQNMKLTSTATGPR